MPFIERRRRSDRRNAPRANVRERRSGMPSVGAEELALESIRFLRGDIKAFVARHGHRAAAYFERAVREWYGPIEGRVALLDACAADTDLHQAWKIVHAAGYRASSLLPLVVRHYYGETTIDRRV